MSFGKCAERSIPTLPASITALRPGISYARTCCTTSANTDRHDSSGVCSKNLIPRQHKLPLASTTATSTTGARNART